MHTHTISQIWMHLWIHTACICMETYTVYAHRYARTRTTFTVLWICLSTSAVFIFCWSRYTWVSVHLWIQFGGAKDCRCELTLVSAVESEKQYGYVKKLGSGRCNTNANGSMSKPLELLKMRNAQTITSDWGTDDETSISCQDADPNCVARHWNPGAGSLFGSENDFGSHSHACHIWLRCAWREAWPCVTNSCFGLT